MNKIKLPEPRYIGDGVYVSFDGYQIILTIGHHLVKNADAAIALEDIVFTKLIEYNEDVKKFYQRVPESEMTNEPELQPLRECPFCGFSHSLSPRINQSPNGLWFYQCGRCSANSPPISIKKELDNIWNNRHQDEKYKKAIEFIKNMIGSPYDRGCHEQYMESQKLLRELGELE